MYGAITLRRWSFLTECLRLQIHTKLSRCMAAIATAASVSTNAMVACKFEQGKQLETKLAGNDSSTTSYPSTTHQHVLCLSLGSFLRERWSSLSTALNFSQLL